MTTLAPAESRFWTDLTQVAKGRTAWELSEHAAMLAMLVFWAVPFTRATGGRGVHHELLFVAVLPVLLLAVRAWRVASGALALAALVALAALLVCIFAPSGWYGSDVAADYALAAATYVMTRRYVRSRNRRDLVVTAICLAGAYQFAQAFLPWWGHRDPATEMTGTFYWHNPYAAFLLPAAVLGLALVVQHRSPWRMAGWISAPLCVAGIVFSSSRATMAALVVGCVLALVLFVRSKGALLRAGGVVALILATTLVLPGPPFFPHRSSPLAATSERASGESLTQNGEYRTEFWRAAAEVALHRPVAGSGFHELAPASALYTQSGWARSPYAHNGYLQAVSDGGLLLGLPFLLAVALLVLAALRRLGNAVWRRGPPSVDAVDIALAVSLLGAFAHSAVDFDWSYPALAVQAALLAGCFGGAAAPARRRRAPRFVALATLAGVLLVLVPALHAWQIDRPSGTGVATSELLARGSAPFGDFRPAQEVLTGYADGDLPLSRSQAAEALDQTAHAASVDIHLSLLRIVAGARAGLIDDPVAAATRELRHVHGSVAPYVLDLAAVYRVAGDDEGLRGVIATDIAHQVDAGQPLAELVPELFVWATYLGRGPAYACELRAAGPLLERVGASDLPPATASCRPSMVKVPQGMSEH